MWMSLVCKITCLSVHAHEYQVAHEYHRYVHVACTSTHIWVVCVCVCVCVGVWHTDSSFESLTYTYSQVWHTGAAGR
jgi:hypothetical protein